MIENIRKYSGLLIVVFVIVIIAFIFGDYSRTLRSSGNGTPVLKVNGTTYTDKEFRNLGTGAVELTRYLAQAGDFALYQFMMGMAGNATSQEEAAEKFFVNRLILRQAKEEFGINPTAEKISDSIRAMRAFADAEGKFDQAKYNNFIDKGIGRLGMTEKDLRDLASDALVSKTLNALIVSGLGVNKEAIAANLALDNQKITADIGRLDLAPFSAKIEPTEEQIKTYWETLQDSFTTEPKRKFAYVLVTPQAPAEPPAEAPPALPADATAEAKAAAAKEAEAKNAARTAAIADEKRKAQILVNTQVDDFLYDLEQQKGAGFQELAAKNKWEVKHTEFFPLSAPPKELDLSLRSSSTSGKAVDSLFKIDPTRDMFSKISEALPVGEGQWLVSLLEGEEKSRTKTYEEAREEARSQYITEKAADALKAAANEAVTKIKAAVAAGKSFADAAKEAGISEIKTNSSITTAYRPDPATEPQNLFEFTNSLDPGAVGDPIVESNRAFIIQVVKREVVKESDAASKLNTEVTNQTTANETYAFLSWLSTRNLETKVEKLNRN